MRTTVGSYAELLQRLVSARRFGIRFGLERMRELLAKLGEPALGTVIHVGGTNGKGSTVAMIAALARAAGKRVATYTSPHLSTLRERVTIDGAMQSEAAWLAAAERASAAGADELTFFEQLTAIGMILIGDANVDVTVLEVGLGGRLDATNALAVAPAVAVVTGVALDHEAILGSTIEAIAFEKAGIFQRGSVAIVGASSEGQAILAEHARAAGSLVQVITDDDLARVPVVALPGAHQRRNAAAAIAAVRAAGLPVHGDALAHVVHPGRFERAGDLILDGAHNPDGARALAATLRELAIRPVLVVAISADKDARAIVGALEHDVSAIVATRYRQERALEPAALAAIAREVTAIAVEVADDVVAAVARARELGSPVLVAGSLFVVGEARSALLGAPTDPIRLSDPPATPR
ncbi:MAG TPA: Mur ligase family protein [Kofleriaceae bacterium]